MTVLANAGPLTLSEIARRTDVNKSTMYSLLVSLTRSGWVLRHPGQKTFHLGPELMVLGRAAGDQMPVLELARPLMLDLVEEYDVPCRAYRRLGSVSVVVDAVLRGDISPAARGQQFPIRPPFGAIFAAWDPPDAAEAWCQSGNSKDPAGSPEVLREELAGIRRRGYSLMLSRENDSGTEELIAQIMRLLDLSHGRRVAELNDLLKLVENTHIEETSLVNTTRGAKYRVRAINAAVLDTTGCAVMAIQLGPFEKSLSAATVKRIGERLRRAVGEISAMLGSGSAESRTR